MRRSYLLIFIALSSLPGCFGCTPAPDYWVDAKPGQKKILVTFPPLYSFTHAVAGDDAYVLCMLTTQGPHGYEGGPTDLFKVERADLLISNGLTLDDQFVEQKMLRNHKNRKLVTLNVGETLLEKSPGLVLKGNGEWHVMPDGAKHKHGEHDPHFWLAPRQAIEMTRIIAAKLGQVDPDKKKGYDLRAEKFVAELKELEDYGKAKFREKKNKQVVTMHESFAYFAKAFDLTIAGSIQRYPGIEPDSVTRGNLVSLCKKKDGPRVIAVEPQYSNAQAEALQASLKKDGIHVEIVMLDPLETADIASTSKFNPDPGYYFKKMRENIDTLAKALP